MNFREERTIVRKITQIETIGIAKLRRKISEVSFQTKFPRKTTKSQEFRRKSLALLLHSTVYQEKWQMEDTLWWQVQFSFHWHLYFVVISTGFQAQWGFRPEFITEINHQAVVNLNGHDCKVLFKIFPIEVHTPYFLKHFRGGSTHSGVHGF